MCMHTNKIFTMNVKCKGSSIRWRHVDCNLDSMKFIITKIHYVTE